MFYALKKGFFRLIVVAMIGSVLAVLNPSAANAVSYVNITARDAKVRGDNCTNVNVYISGNWDADFSNEIDVDVYDSRGQWAGGDYFWDEYSHRVVTTVFLCGDYDPSGRYTVQVTATGYDEDYIETGTVYEESTFRFTVIPKSNTRIARKIVKTPNRTYKMQVPGQLLKAGRAYAGRKVTIQARISGYWYDIESQRTNRRGKFSWRFKPIARSYVFRYTFEGNELAKPSRSKTWRNPTKGHGKAIDGHDLSSLVVPL